MASFSVEYVEMYCRENLECSGGLPISRLPTSDFTKVFTETCHVLMGPSSMHFIFLTGAYD